MATKIAKLVVAGHGAAGLAAALSAAEEARRRRTAIDITICTPPLDLKPDRTHRDRSTPRPPQPPTRRQRIMAVLSATGIEVRAG